jgi:hypothetical protein
MVGVESRMDRLRRMRRRGRQSDRERNIAIHSKK